MYESPEVKLWVGGKFVCLGGGTENQRTLVKLTSKPAGLNDYTFGNFIMLFILHITHTKLNCRWIKDLDIKN